jgi:hypothetical protein
VASFIEMTAAAAKVVAHVAIRILRRILEDLATLPYDLAEIVIRNGTLAWSGWRRAEIL